MTSNVCAAPRLEVKGLEGFETVCYWDLKDGNEARIWRKGDTFQISSSINGGQPTTSAPFNATGYKSPEELIKHVGRHIPRIQEDGQVQFIQNRIAKSILDPTKTIDRLNSAVTLIDRRSCARESKISTLFGHAVIIIETIENNQDPELDGKHRIWKADFQLTKLDKIIIVYEEANEKWINECGVPFKTETWIRASTLVQKMICRIKLEATRTAHKQEMWTLNESQIVRLASKIKKDRGKDSKWKQCDKITPTFSGFVFKRPISDDECPIMNYNCMIWVKERIFLADIHLPTSLIHPLLRVQTPSGEIGSISEGSSNPMKAFLRSSAKAALLGLAVLPGICAATTGGLLFLGGLGASNLVWNVGVVLGAGYIFVETSNEANKDEKYRYELFKSLVEEGEI